MWTRDIPDAYDCTYAIIHIHLYTFIYIDMQIDEGDFIIWNFSLGFFNKLKIVLDKNWMISSRVYFDVIDIFVRGRVGVVV